MPATAAKEMDPATEISTRVLKKRRNNNRVDDLLDAAARLFAEKGYKATTTRDIANAVNMQSGAVYYHFKSKGELLLAVFEVGADRISSQVRQAIETEDQPIDKLGAALQAHLDVILDANAYAGVMGTVRPSDVPGFKDQLVAQRDRYEEIFVALMGDLDFDPAIDPVLLRMFLIGAANYAQVWYRPGNRKPAYLAEQLVLLVKGSLNNNASERSDTTRDIR